MRDWKPRSYVRPDGQAAYCAPTCGHHCLRSDYDKALRLARSTAKKMTEQTGVEWKPNVWENLGWHWSIQNGHADIYRTSDGFRCNTRGGYQVSGEGKSAFAAHKAALAGVERVVGDFMKTWAGMTDTRLTLTTYQKPKQQRRG